MEAKVLYPGFCHRVLPRCIRNLPAYGLASIGKAIPRMFADLTHQDCYCITI